MTEMGLDQGAQLAEGAMVFGNLKERIVTESAAAGGDSANPASAQRLAFALDHAGGIGNTDVAAWIAASAAVVAAGAAVVMAYTAVAAQAAVAVADVSSSSSSSGGVAVNPNSFSPSDFDR